MKKIYLALAILSVLAVFGATFAMAQDTIPNSCTLRVATGITGCPTGGSVNYDTIYPPNDVRGATCCLFSTINYAINWVFFILITIAVVMILIAAFNFLFSGGDPGKTTTARNYLIFAAIGIAIALLARAIPFLVKTLLGV